MNTYEFEVAAKNAISKAMMEKYHQPCKIQDISVVWMTHLLGYKKGVFIAHCTPNWLYEVTYNREKNEMYLDIYCKQVNRVIQYTDFNFKVKQQE